MLMHHKGLWREALYQIVSYEYLSLESKEAVVMFSGKVLKWNKYGIKQDRNLIITNINVYNFKRKKMRRMVPISKLAGLTKLLAQNS